MQVITLKIACRRIAGSVFPPCVFQMIWLPFKKHKQRSLKVAPFLYPERFHDYTKVLQEYVQTGCIFVSEKKQLILLRHGKTDCPNRYVGSRDVPLSPQGVSQIKTLENILHDMEINRIISSPMLRCRQSCELLFAGRPVRYEENLREIDFGRWEGMTFAEIAESDPALVEQWADWSLDFCFPGGESIGHFVDRVTKTAQLLAGLQEKNVMLVCHGGVIRALLCYYLGLGPENYLLFQIEKGNFSTLDLYGERGVLTGLNLG